MIDDLRVVVVRILAAEFIEIVLEEDEVYHVLDHL